jgi:hypothetical protein
VSRRIPWAAAPLAAAILIVVTLVLAVVVHLLAYRSSWSGLGLVPLYLAFGLMGLIVTWHQPRNLLGWVLLGIAFFFLLDVLVESYTLLDYRGHHGTLPLGALGILLAPAAFGPAVILVGLSLLLFPDGRVPAKRWKPMLWAYLALGGLWLVGAFAVSARAIISHHISVDSGGSLTALDSPPGLGTYWGVAVAVFFPAIVVCWLIWLIGQVLSYRRAAGERRLQLKWLLSGATVFIVATIAQVWISHPAGWWRVAAAVATVGTFALPVSIGFGIMKFRLYDIDRIISRTLAYALVTGALVGVYAGLVLLATRVFTVTSPVAVAASTLVAAALFSSLRRRVQHAVDRKFNRARYDADQTVAAFAGRLQDAVDLDTVRVDLTGVVNAALEPAHVSVWTAGPAARDQDRLFL